jgi:hypothetical protein
MTSISKVVLGSVAAVLGLILIIMLFTFRGYSVPSDMVAVHVGAGPFEAKKIKGDCIPSSTRGFFTNDDYEYFPTSEREWDATGQKGSDSDLFQSVTNDKVVMDIPVTIRFSLRTDCETLQDFYIKYARRYGVHFDNDGTYNDEWITVLRKIVADPADQTLDRIIQQYNWQAVWNDPTTKTEIEQKLTEALQSDNSLLVQTAHKSYFDGISVLVGKPIPPKALADAVATEQTKVAQAQAEEAQAKAEEAKAIAQQAVAKAEATKQQEEINGYRLEGMTAQEAIRAYNEAQLIAAGGNPWQPQYIVGSTIPAK